MKRKQEHFVTAKDEAARLAAVHRYSILYTPPDGTFDDITALAARVFDVPIALLSIVDRDRIWFKSCHGLDIRGIDREPGLCASAILRDGPTIISDTKLDPHSQANPLVAGDVGLRFYAAAPLITVDGFRLGTLCVMDRQPRKISANQVKVLEALAGVVMDELDLRLDARVSARRSQSRYEHTLEQSSMAEQQVRQAFDFAPVGMAVLSVDFLLLEVNAALCDMLGYRESDLLLTGIADLMHPGDAERCLQAFSVLAYGQLRNQETECRCLAANGSEIRVRMLLSSTVEGFDAHPVRIIVHVEPVSEPASETMLPRNERPKGQQPVELPR